MRATPGPGSRRGGVAGPRRGPRVLLLFFVGSLLLQSAWILALPPFRGTDEFDHAYRAAAVAGGQWRSPGVAAEHGRGDLVVVPRALVEAAGPVCSALPYTGPANCSPVRGAGHGDVQVASAAARYNPLFYWAVGTAGAPFSGAGSLYAMRVASALLCALLVALAGWVTSSWARSAWPFAAIAVAATPVMVFSTSVAAPNGLEMCAGLVVWSALLGLRSPAATERHGRRLLVVATTGATVLVTVRTLGPLWLLLISLTVLVLVGPGRLACWLRPRRGLAGACAGWVLLASLAAVAWTTTASTNALEPVPTEVPNRLVGTLEQLPLWFLQGVAAFPRRSDAAPSLVYVVVGVVALALLGLGVARADRRLRVAMVLVLVVAVAVPVALTINTIRETGAVWQGRYGLPYHLGLTLLAGVSLDASAGRREWETAGRWAGAAALVLAHVVAVEHVLARELGTSPLAGTGEWLQPPPWAVAVLLTAGFVAWTRSWPEETVVAEPDPMPSASVRA